MSKIVFIVIVVIIIAGAIYYEKRRSDGMSVAARKLGFDYHPAQQGLPPELDAIGFDLFTQGPPNIRNRMQGHRNGREVTLFEFTYNASSAGEGQRETPIADDYRSIETRAQSVIWIRSNQALPDFDLSPGNTHRRTVGERFGLGRVTLDGAAEFNRSHILLARDDVRVRALFDADLLEYLAQHPRIVVESRGRDTLFYRFEQLNDPGKISEFVDQAEALLGLLQR